MPWLIQRLMNQKTSSVSMWAPLSSKNSRAPCNQRQRAQRSKRGSPVSLPVKTERRPPETSLARLHAPPFLGFFHTFPNGKETIVRPSSRLGGPERRPLRPAAWRRASFATVQILSLARTRCLCRVLYTGEAGAIAANAMVKLLFNHSPAFVAGELLLALALIIFVIALLRAATDRIDRGRA